jgi:hypothetical protein
MLARPLGVSLRGRFVYDTSFDDDHSRRIDRTVLWALRIVGLVGTIVAVSAAEAQMPGAPVLQNAWSTPGIVGALNITGGSDGSTYAAAGSWTPGSARFQFSGGLGLQQRAGSGSSVAYGARVAMPFGGASSSFGFAAFAGIGGGGSSTKKATTTVVADTADSTSSTAKIPVGVGIGWRHAFGGVRGLSLYATPSYVFHTGGSSSGAVFRTAIAADFGITRQIGATAGVEFGQTRGRAAGGPSGTLYGIGVSYALGRR